MNRLIVLASIFVAILVVSVFAKALLARRHALVEFDVTELANVSGENGVVIFTSPYCHACRQWVDALEARGVAPVQIDVSARADLANRYRISVTPRIAVARASDGAVLREFHHFTPREHDLETIVELTQER